MTIEPPKSITVDGVEYPVDQFGDTIKQLVAIHTAWRNDLQEERLSVAKTEAAMRALDAELAQAVNKELNPPEEEAANEEPETIATTVKPSKKGPKAVK